MQRFRVSISFVLLFVLLFVILLDGLANSAQAQQRTELRVAAASDLTRAFGEIARAYESKTGQKITLLFGSSGQLTQQISNGAPFDLFASASETYIDTLDKQGLIVPNTRQRYARGKLVLWSNTPSVALPRDLAELTAPRFRHIAIANPAHAPYGMAAKEALQIAGVWDKLQSRLVIGENIQQTHQFAASGNAEIALISRSLLDPEHPTPNSRVKPVPDKLYSPLVQSMAQLKSSSHPTESLQFLRFVTGSEGQRILRRFGFEKP